MELAYSKEDEAFRKEVRSWLKKNLPKKDKAVSDLMPHDPERVKRAKEWQRKLYDAGYVAMGWPKEYGGQAADVMRQTIVNEEMVLARAPGLVGASGLGMLGPTLIQLGTEEQKRRYLPKILTAEEIWCQGYSEPGAGSDLASLRTKAELVGDYWVVNGQKIWTSNAEAAHWMFCLVRTEPQAPKHEGISYLLIDMKTPGITVRPLRQMTGDADFNEVFFDNVRVPAESVVGKRGQGWVVSRSTLKHERALIGGSHLTRRTFDGLVMLAKALQAHGRPAIEDPVVRGRLVELEARLLANEYQGYRLLTLSARGEEPGLAGLVMKLASTTLGHDIANLALDVIGDRALLAPGEPNAPAMGMFGTAYMWSLGVLIAGGTANIQRNIIAERGLGLP